MVLTNLYLKTSRYETFKAPELDMGIGRMKWGISDITGLHKVELRYLYRSAGTVGAVKCKRIQLAGHVACRRNTKSYIMLVCKFVNTAMWNAEEEMGG